MEDIISKLWEIGTPLGMLAIAIIYFYRRDVKKEETITEKDKEIANLNKELRESLERNLNKSNEALSNNTIALNAFKEALRNA